MIPQFPSSGAMAPMEPLSRLMERAPVFPDRGPFERDLARRQEIEAGLMNTAMQGGATVREAKIIADSNVKQAEIAAKGSKTQRMAALLPLLASGGLGSTGGRVAGQALQVNGDPSAPLGSYNRLSQEFINMDKLTKYWAAPGAIAARGAFE